MNSSIESFYERAFVKRLAEIFNSPQKPAIVTQVQFDDAQEKLVATAQKEWHEIDRSDYWHYLLDLCYVSLQQDLFDYLFPAFLIKWWEGQRDRFGGPESECDLYYAIDQGELFDTMMNSTRRSQVYDWMVDAYMDGVEEWSGKLTVEYNSEGPDNLHLPLWSFWALGQSVPILDLILTRLENVSNLGIAQWWLVLATGIAYDDNKCPYIPAWTPDGGGGGVYVLGSSASIYTHGLLDANLVAVKNRLSVDYLIERVDDSMNLLENSEYADWAEDVRFVIVEYKQRSQERCELLISFLAEPDLGGVVFNPLSLE